MGDWDGRWGPGVGVEVGSKVRDNLAELQRCTELIKTGSITRKAGSKSQLREAAAL